VGTKELKKNAVTNKKAKNRSLKAVDFAAGQLPKGPKGDPEAGRRDERDRAAGAGVGERHRRGQLQRRRARGR
jgi:hypothetical protein